LAKGEEFSTVLPHPATALPITQISQQEKKIKLSTPIQLHGQHVALSRTHLFGIAFTESGKPLLSHRQLHDLLEKCKLKLDSYTYLCLDEADKMVHIGFKEGEKNIMSFFKHQRKTLLISATMPKNIHDFARNIFVKAVVVDIGCAGTANLNFIQVSCNISYTTDIVA
jgi:superfamily II DNA/RNA helicase